MTCASRAALQEIRQQLLELRRRMLAIEREQATLLDAAAAPWRASARNLLHVAAFDRHHHHAHPHRNLREAVRRQGLSTLAGCDAHLLASLSHLLTVVDALGGTPAGIDGDGHGLGSGTSPGPQPPTSDEQGQALLQSNSERLLGSSRAVMVTLPSAAADDPALIPELVSSGMDVAWIHCAHHPRELWAALAGQVRTAAQTQQRPCRIAMDLAGPRLRTGPLPSLPGVVAARPERDRYGRLVQPVRILALPQGSAPPPESDPQLVLLPVVGNSWRQLDSGDRLRSRDASGRWRELVVDRRLDHGVVLHCRQHCRFIAGLVFRQEGGPVRLEVAALPECPGELLLRRGDRLRLGGETIGHQASPALGPARVGCSLPEVLGDLEAGQRVLFDEGRIGAVVVTPAGRHSRAAAAAAAAAAADPYAHAHDSSEPELEPELELEVELEIVEARPKGSHLRAGKGINLPDTRLRRPALSARERDDLCVACRHADLVIASGVRSGDDIACLRRALAEQGSPCPGLVLRIETRQAFLNLPRLLLAAMAAPIPLGVMIARDALAVECGRDGLSAIEQEIQRVCAAAHVPCIRAANAAVAPRVEALMCNQGGNGPEPLRTLGRVVGDSGGDRTDLRTHRSTGQADPVPTPLSCLCL